MKETPSLGQEDPLEKDMGIHSSIPAWEIPWTEEPGGLQSIESKRVRHDWSDWACTMSGVGVFVAYKRDADPYCLPSGSWTIRVDTKKSRLHKLCFTSYAWKQVSNPDSDTRIVSQKAEELDAVFQYLLLAVD